MEVHSDSPIRNREEDELGRDPYAASIARMIHNYAPTDSVVIGLAGKWGSGKSSLINLIIEHLKGLGRGIDPVIMRFNPWRYAGTDYLFASFFSAMAKELGVGDKLEPLRDASKRLNRYGKVLGALKIAPLKIASVFGSVGQFLQLGSASVEELLKDAGTLEALHDDLTVELLTARTRILVIIDDIDRLAPGDILKVFQLVKSLADFPYVMYLLAYDESVVLRAIDEEPDVARRYLEKIVTLPIDVPQSHRSAIDNMLLSRMLDPMKCAIPPFIDEKRLLDVFVQSWRHYADTVRDVTRFLNAFGFNYARAGHELDVGDLAAITALQVFEHALYGAMPKHADAFVDTVEAIFRGDKSTPKENRERIEEILSRVQFSNRDVALDTLRALFYKVDLAWRGHSYELTLNDERPQHRACVPDYFYKYFNMGVLPNELEPSEFTTALRMACGRDADLIPFLKRLGVDKAMDFVDRIPDASDIQSRPWDERINFTASIFDIAASFDFPAARGFMPFSWKVGHAIDYALETSDPELWTDGFLRAASMTTALAPVVSQLHLDLALKKEQKNRSVPPLSQPQVSKLQSTIVRRVSDAVATGQLKESPDLARILYVLQDWEERAVASRLVDAISNRPSMALSYVISARERPSFEGFLKPLPVSFDLKSIDKSIPVATLRKLLQSFDESTLDDLQKETLRSFLRESQHFKSDRRSSSNSP